MLGVLKYIEGLYADSASYADAVSLIRARSEMFAKIVLEDSEDAWQISNSLYERYSHNGRSYLARIVKGEPTALIGYYHKPKENFRLADVEDSCAFLVDLEDIYTLEQLRN